MNDKENAADITSEVFLKALVHLNRFVHKGFPFSAWLYRIAINECNQWFRDKNHQRYTILDSEMAKDLGEELLPDREGDEKLMQKLAVAMQALELKDLQMIELRFFEKKSFKEIGYMLDMSENNATVKTHRILKRMKKRISR